MCVCVIPIWANPFKESEMLAYISKKKKQNKTKQNKTLTVSLRV